MNDRALCGTYTAYQQHAKWGEVPDKDCCEAAAIYMTQWRRRRMLGLPITREPLPVDLTAPRWVETCGDFAQVGAVFRAGVVMGA